MKNIIKKSFALALAGFFCLSNTASATEQPNQNPVVSTQPQTPNVPQDMPNLNLEDLFKQLNVPGGNMLLNQLLPPEIMKQQRLQRLEQKKAALAYLVTELKKYIQAQSQGLKISEIMTWSAFAVLAIALFVVCIGAPIKFSSWQDTTRKEYIDKFTLKTNVDLNKAINEDQTRYAITKYALTEVSSLYAAFLCFFAWIALVGGLSLIPGYFFTWLKNENSIYKKALVAFFADWEKTHKAKITLPEINTKLEKLFQQFNMPSKELDPYKEEAGTFVHNVLEEAEDLEVA